MQTEYLSSQTPKSGRSRFSKALPAPPSLPSFGALSSKSAASTSSLTTNNTVASSLPTPVAAAPAPSTASLPPKKHLPSLPSWLPREREAPAPTTPNSTSMPAATATTSTPTATPASAATTTTTTITATSSVTNLPPWPPREKEQAATVTVSSLPPWPPREKEEIASVVIPASKLMPWPPKEKSTPPPPINPSLLQLSPLRSPRMASMAAAAAASAASKPLDSPLPPLPLKAAAPQPPPMSIPRRPLVASKEQPALPPAEPSPTGSISSLLSAYSHTSGESLVRSADGTDSSKASSEPTLSPTQPELSSSLPEALKNRELPPVAAVAPLSLTPKPRPLPSSTRDDGERQRALDLSRRLEVEEKKQRGAAATLGSGTMTSAAPPPPAKDEVKPPPPAPKQHESEAPVNTSSSPVNASPGGSTQLWRRRSLKGDRGVEVPELKLVTSHGSTAESQSQAQSATAVKSSTVTPKTGATYSPFPPTAAPNASSSPLHPPRGSSAAGLPGRNIRPSPSRDQLLPTTREQQSSSRSFGQTATPEEAGATAPMGHNASKIKHRLHAHDQAPADAPTTQNLSLQSESGLPQPPQRLPTPEYRKGDVQPAHHSTVRSPISPASSPEPGSKRTPVHAARSLPNLKEPAAQTNPEAPPPIARDFVVEGPAREQQPQPPADPASSRANGQQPPPQLGSRFPPRSSSTRPKQPWRGASREREGASAPQGQGSASAVQPEAPRQQPAETLAKSDTAEYKEVRQEDLPEPDPRATYFPTVDHPIYQPGDVVRSQPLKETMFRCFAAHQPMRITPNKHYPLTCQTCQRADDSDRWKCTFCNLRICKPCFSLLNSYKRDLHKLVDHLEQQTTDAEGGDGSAPDSPSTSGPAGLTPAASGSASAGTSRPTSSGGLETVLE